MSYQVLARKWRPRNFKELVGQIHVLQALVNALDHNRLHHAYLFTGTRGVGKTTIARILAKCLNCETGITSEPCGQCSACKEINEGRFVDLIEVDAASRTRLEDTKELLDNVQYAPTRGRFKVYLIDEVHMLSTHSFNALLKTLEEPPPHVKFLLATTDPHKLPITILSRCLQFSLKNMSPDKVVGHLQHVLEAENVPFDMQALWQLGRAADGSMRDALSLTDQAIAYCGDRLTSQGVTAMLGTIDQDQVYRLLDALVAGHAYGVLQAVAELSEHGPDYVAVLAEMLSALHRIALAQAVPDVVDNSQGDRERILALAGRITSEDIQLFYQTGLIGRRDLPLAPEPRSGFEMVLLRMLAFRPDGVPTAPTQQLSDHNGDRARDVVDTPASSSGAQEAKDEPEPDAEQAVAEVEQPPVLQPEPESEQVQSEPEVELPPPVVEQEDEDNDPPPWLEQPAAEPVSTVPEPVSVPVVENVAETVVENSAKQGPTPNSGLSEGPPLSAYDDQPIGPSEYEDDSGYPIASGYGIESVAPEIVPEMTPQTMVVPEEVMPVAVPEAPVVEILPPVAMTDGQPEMTLTELTTERWIPLHESLGVVGVAGTILSNCELLSVSGTDLFLRLDAAHDTFYSETNRQRLQVLLSRYFETDIVLHIETGVVVGETPAVWRERRRTERLAEARKSFVNDVHVQAIVAAFSGTILEDTIEPVG